MDSLTPKQQQFVLEYCVDMNASAAAVRSGYSKRMSKAIGWELLQKPHVAAAIAKEMAAREKRTRVSADRALEQLARVAFFDPRKMFAADGALKPIDTMGDDEAAAIAAFEVVETATGSIVRKVRLADRMAALEKIGKHLGLFRDRVELSSDPANPFVLLMQQAQGASTFTPATGKNADGEEVA